MGLFKKAIKTVDPTEAKQAEIKLLQEEVYKKINNAIQEHLDYGHNNIDSYFRRLKKYSYDQAFIGTPSRACRLIMVTDNGVTNKIGFEEWEKARAILAIQTPRESYYRKKSIVDTNMNTELIHVRTAIPISGDVDMSLGYDFYLSDYQNAIDKIKYFLIEYNYALEKIPGARNK